MRYTIVVEIETNTPLTEEERAELRAFAGQEAGERGRILSARIESEETGRLSGHSLWCALIASRSTTCDCDKFEREGRPC